MLKSSSSTPDAAAVSPLTELETIIQRLDVTLDTVVHQAYQEAVKDVRAAAVQAAREAEAEARKAAGKSSSSSSSFFSSLASLRTSSATKKKNTDNSSSLDSCWREFASPRSERAKRGSLSANKVSSATFIQTLPVEQVVEDLRRLAELVVIGENYVTTQEKKKEQKEARRKAKWNSDRDSIEGVGSTAESESDDDENDTPECADLFDLFFERSALETIVHLLTGSAFDLVDHVEHLKHVQVLKGGNEDDPENIDPETAIMELPAEAQERVLLPPIAVATQAIQSISILIQNVSRATSLYIILSNDHINTLIDLSLDRYATAERNRRADDGDESRAIFASPEMSELTTHFISLLKSLTMRMNAETLQFFLKYPMEGETGVPISSPHYSPKREKSSGGGGDGDGANDKGDSNHETAAGEGTQEALQVSFPLYQRALDFCAAHQESFVRVTAMNICLNTLRLTTIEPEASPEPPPKTDVEEEGAFGSAALISLTPKRPKRSVSSPDGVLHTAQALPFRERLAIARYTCIPSRVERLIAPIFTKLSERWTALDEAIREIDENKGPALSVRLDKVAQAKEKVRRQRLVRSFQDKAADLQDELMLLEDVFKVGLTVLNEQMIEMMFATFVYPMISQPLLNFYQRYNSQMDQARVSTQQHPFGSFGGDYSDIASMLAPFSGPAKTSLFTIASVFHSLSNPQLLRLLYTALFHPLSPDSTSVPTVRSNLLVSTTDVNGHAAIRLDALRNNEGPIPNDRSTYPFGTTANNRRLSRTNAPDLAKLEDKEVCVFVLAPALAEVLEFDGHDMGLIARTRPNSYRESILKCFDMPHEFADVRALATCAVDAAVTPFNAKFAADIMLGTDMKTFADDIPADERNLDSEEAHRADDRGLGGSATYESRHNVTRRRGGNVGSDLTGEFVAAMCKGTIFASRDRHEGWKLEYDPVAGHAMLCIGKGNSRALVQTSKVLDNRWRQAAAFIAERPGSMYNPMGGSSSLFPPGAPNANAEDYEEQLFGSIMNTVLFEESGETDGEPVVEQCLRLKAPAEQAAKERLSVPISNVSSFESICKQIGTLLLASVDSELEGEDADLAESRASALAIMKLDALLSLLKDLAASGGIAMRDMTLEGIALSATGLFVQTMDYKLSRQIYAPISASLTETMMSHVKSSRLPETGSVLPLAGKKAIPCVCEAPASVAHLFLDSNTGVQAEGVTWQSLYLVFLDDTLIFAQPIPNGPGGDGRVITACYTECLKADHDAQGQMSPAPARRLLLSHTSFEDSIPPQMFLYDEKPTSAEVGPFVRVQPYVSHLDVWFEHQRAADMAYKILTTHIFQAKANRGRRIQAFLDPRGHYLN